MDKKYQDNEAFTFLKVIILVFLFTPFLASVGYIAVKNLKIHYYLYALIYGQLAVLFIKSIFEYNKRNFISDITKKTLEPILELEYEKIEWRNFIKKILKKKVKKNAIISIAILLISFILIIVGYNLKNDGEFALAVGYNLFMFSIFWVINAYIFIIYPLLNSIDSKVKKIQCYKYGLVLTNNYFVLKTFNYIVNVSIKKVDNKMNICFTDETRGTSVDGHDDNVITKVYIPIPEKNINISDEICIKAFRSLI